MRAQFKEEITKQKRAGRGMRDFKIKTGYRFVLDESEESSDLAVAPEVYNVPNPPSAIDSTVDDGSLQAALVAHCESTVRQIESLPPEVRQKLVA